LSLVREIITVACKFVMEDLKLFIYKELQATNIKNQEFQFKTQLKFKELQENTIESSELHKVRPARYLLYWAVPQPFSSTTPFDGNTDIGNKVAAFKQKKTISYLKQSSW